MVSQKRVARGISCRPVQIFLEREALESVLTEMKSGSANIALPLLVPKNDVGATLFLLSLGGAGCIGIIDFFRLFGGRLHAVFEGTNALSKPLAELGKLLGAKYKQRYRQNNQQVCRLKQSFNHELTLSPQARAGGPTDAGG